MGMAPPGLGSVSRCSELMIRQARAIKSIDLIACTSISLVPLNLIPDSMTPVEWPADDVVGRPISGRPCVLTEEVVGFPLSPHSPPHGQGLYIRRATTTKRRAHNNLVACLPARGLKFGVHTNQEAHGAPWFGARGLNTGLSIPGGAPLRHSCYGSISTKKIPYIYTAC